MNFPLLLSFTLMAAAHEPPKPCVKYLSGPEGMHLTTAVARLHTRFNGRQFMFISDHLTLSAVQNEALGFSRTSEIVAADVRARINLGQLSVTILSRTDRERARPVELNWVNALRALPRQGESRPERVVHLLAPYSSGSRFAYLMRSTVEDRLEIPVFEISPCVDPDPAFRFADEHGRTCLKSFGRFREVTP